MSKKEERFKLIEKSVLEQATQKSKAIRKQADDYKSREIDDVETKILGELYGKIQDEISDISNSSALNVSRYEGQHHQQLLLRRDELTREIFAAARCKLLEYAGTDAYREQLMTTAKQLAETYAQSGGVVYVRPADAQLVPELTKLLGGWQVETDETIKIGGIKLMNQQAGFFVDETLDTRLEEQRPWFYSNSGLTIQ